MRAKLGDPKARGRAGGGENPEILILNARENSNLRVLERKDCFGKRCLNATTLAKGPPPEGGYGGRRGSVNTGGARFDQTVLRRYGGRESSRNTERPRRIGEAGRMAYNAHINGRREFTRESKGNGASENLLHPPRKFGSSKQGERLLGENERRRRGGGVRWPSWFFLSRKRLSREAWLTRSCRIR